MFILILLSSVFAFGQNDFRKGYVVKLNNDTLFGLIDYRGNKENAKNCYFKESLNHTPTRFAPGEINAYGFENSNKYISSNLITDKQTDTVFLEHLIDAVVDLYYLRNNDSEELFYLSSPYHETDYLQNTSDKTKVEGITYEHENKEYITTLSRFFDNNTWIKPRLERLSYTQKSILNIVNDYNRVEYPDSMCVIHHRYSSKPKFTWGLAIGGSVQWLRANEYMIKEESWLKNSNFNTLFVPQIGIFARLNLPEIDERYSIQFDMTYNRFNAESHHQNTLIVNPVISDVLIRRQGLDNSLQLFYLFPETKFRMQLHGGIFTNWFFNTDYYLENKQLDYEGNVSYSYEYTKSPFQNIDLGFVIGAGTSFKCLNKELLIDLSYKHNLSYDKGGTKLRNLVLDGFSLKAYWPIGK